MSRRMHPPFQGRWLVLEKKVSSAFCGILVSERRTDIEQVVAVGYYKSVLIAFLVDKGNLALLTGLGRVQVTVQQRG